LLDIFISIQPKQAHVSESAIFKNKNIVCGERRVVWTHTIRVSITINIELRASTGPHLDIRLVNAKTFISLPARRTATLFILFPFFFFFCFPAPRPHSLFKKEREILKGSGSKSIKGTGSHDFSAVAGQGTSLGTKSADQKKVFIHAEQNCMYKLLSSATHI
jgi:hypothetical protein